MKKLLLLILILSVVFTSTLFCQDKKTYVAFNYIKAKPGKGGDYVALVKNYSTKILDYAVKSGAFSGWYFYELRMPVGAANDYDYVAVSVVNDFKYLFEEPGTFESILKQYIPGITDLELKKIAEQFEASRISVKREIFTKTSDLVPDAVPARYARVDYNLFAEGKEAEYVAMETETMKPIHQEIIAQGKYNDWELLKKMMPSDSRSDFNYVAIDYINDINTFVNLNYPEILKKAAPNLDVPKLINTITTTKKATRGELWELVVAVDGRTKK